MLFAEILFKMKLTQSPTNRSCDGLPESSFSSMFKFNAAPLGPTVTDFHSSVQSPCIGKCCLDDDFTCLGCFRSLEEIKDWGVVDDYRRRIVLQIAAQRRAACLGGE
jgi:uncharacterized protein